jgi:microcystin degradation protein MlrC
MVVEGIPDGEGALLREVRDKVGANVPVVATLDFHSNLTEEMLEYADVLVGYNTYPHVDMADRGQESADILARIIRAGLKPVSVLSKPRLLPSLVAQKTDVGPFKKLYNKAYEAEENPDIVDVSVYGGFPYADIEPAGMGIIVTTDADSELAESTAKELEEYAYSIKEEMLVSLPSPDEAVERALAHEERPVVVADVADNPGAGGSCDETALLRALLNQGASGAAVFLADPEAVSAAFAAGVGSTTELSLGGKYSEDGERTLEVSAYVKLLSDGEFVYKGPQSKGLAGQLGKTAVLMIDDVTVVVAEHRVQTRDPEIFRFVGIEPNECRAVVLKSSVHYRAAFKPLAAEIIEAAGPDAAPPELGLHTYNNLRRPIFPLDCE